MPGSKQQVFLSISQIFTHSNDSRNTGIPGPLQNGFAVRIENRIAQVRVSINNQVHDVKNSRRQEAENKSCGSAAVSAALLTLQLDRSSRRRFGSRRQRAGEQSWDSL
jgi:hypothetical protein